MKLVLSAALLAAGAASASAHAVIRGDAARQLMKASIKKQRNLENEDEDEEEEEEEYAWMQNYKVKFVGCIAGEKFQNAENGEYEYSSVIYRLCDKSAECDAESNFGCSDENSYGDYVVGINTYTQAYAESLEEDDRRKLKQTTARRLDEEEFNLREFAECGKIDIEDDEDRRRKLDEADVEYFVGPACSEDGKDIVLQLFADEDCSYEPDVTFYELAGQNLPYYDGGLAVSACQSCLGEKDDDGDYETSEMCMQMAEGAGKCDESDNSYCEKIEALTAELRAEEQSGNGWKIFWIIVGILLLGGIGWWFYKKQLARKAASGVDTTPIGGAMS